MAATHGRRRGIDGDDSDTQDARRRHGVVRRRAGRGGPGGRHRGAGSLRREPPHRGRHPTPGGGGLSRRGPPPLPPHGRPVIEYGDYDKIMPQFAGLSEAGVLNDIDASIAYLETAGFSLGRIGVVGFCMGGTVAFLASARRPLGAGVTFYGGGVTEGRFGMASMVELGPELQTPWLGLYGDEDQGIPLEPGRGPATGGGQGEGAHRDRAVSRGGPRLPLRHAPRLPPRGGRRRLDAHPGLVRAAPADELTRRTGSEAAQTLGRRPPIEREFRTPPRRWPRCENQSRRPAGVRETVANGVVGGAWRPPYASGSGVSTGGAECSLDWANPGGNEWNPGETEAARRVSRPHPISGRRRCGPDRVPGGRPGRPRTGSRVERRASFRHLRSEGKSRR